MVVEGTQHVDLQVVKGYAEDLQALLEAADSTQSKALLRSFVKRITIDGDKVKIQFHIPLPPEGKTTAVLPIITPSGAEGIRTPYLLVANETFSQLNYGPMRLRL